MEVLAGTITTLVEVVLAPVGKCIKHHRSLKEDMNDLKKKNDELKGRKVDIERRCRVELLPEKTLKKEVELWLANVERINADVHAMEEEVKKVNYLCRSWMGKRVCKKIKELKVVHQNGSFPDSLAVDADVLGEVTLPTAKLAGKTTAERKMEEIWDFLMNDDVRKIGVYGMGGSGKTTTVKHVYNRLLKMTDKFDKLIWVTVSKFVDIINLQHHIAKELKLQFSNVEDETKMSSELFHAFERRKRYVLILDDMWESFDLVSIGIPEPTQANGCKLVITTRSLEVCRRMDCKDSKMELLSKQEAWELFLDKVGHHILATPDIEAIAKQVAEECDRLPLAIVVVARSLKSATSMSEWSNALAELRSSTRRHDEMDTQVLERLKFSYDRLKDDRLRKCLLHCALYPEDFLIEREELIEHLIAEGIIEELDRLQEKLNKGHTMLTKLENACLLECVGDYSRNKCVRMHDLIRDMAVQILSESSPTMVKAGMQLREIPDEEKWTRDLERVSLMENNIREVLSCSSPNCSNLSTLLLCRNPLERIADSFFLQLHELKVLDFSDTNIEKLPDSVCNLENLTTLLLRRCRRLKCISSLAKLKALRKLDLDESRLEEVPQGMGMCVDLRYLNLNTGYLKKIPYGVLPRLSRLQVLILNPYLGNCAIKVEEVVCLRKLEILTCQFCNLRDFNRYSSYLAECHGSLMIKYKLEVGKKGWTDVLRDFSSEKKVSLWNCKLSRECEEPLVLPRDVDGLEIEECHDIASLSDVSSLENVTKLDRINLRRCDRIECVIPLTSLCKITVLESLKTLRLDNLPNLRVLLSGEGAAASPPVQAPKVGTFSHLNLFEISGCPNIKKLFPPSLLPHLQNLEKVWVKHCENLEEIIATGAEEEERNIEEEIMVEESNNNNPSVINNYDVQFTLPKLRVLLLKNLPRLKSICCRRGVMICDSLQEMTIFDCEKLKRIPLSIPLLENGQPSPPPSLITIRITPKKHWESLEWDHPNTKNVLQPLLYKFEKTAFWG